MAVQSVFLENSATTAAPAEEPRLSYEENWDLIFSLFGSAKDSLAEYGGGEAYLRAERSSWNDSESA